MRSHLDRLVTEKTLSFINSMTSSDLPSQLPDDFPVKNVCAKVTTELSDQIDKTCAFLGISKRRFLEAAFIDAVDIAHEIINREGLHEAYQEAVSVRESPQ